MEKFQYESIVIHVEDFGDIDELKDSDAGKLLKAILEYASTGNVTVKLSVQAKTMFGFIRRRIDRDKLKYEEKRKKRSEAGKKGGRPRKQIEAYESNEKQENQMLFDESKKSLPVSVPVPVPVSVPVYDTVYDPEPAAQLCAPMNETVSGFGEEQTEDRIGFLKSMIGLYKMGVLTDKQDYAEWCSELKRLEGRSAG